MVNSFSVTLLRATFSPLSSSVHKPFRIIITTGLPVQSFGLILIGVTIATQISLRK